MCSPSAPAAPDYVGAAQQQGEANLEAARATAKLNNPNVITPYGTQTVTYGSGNKLDTAAYNKAMSDYEAAMAAYTNGDPNYDLFRLGVTNNAAYSGGKPVMPNASDYMITGGDPDIATVTQTLSPAQQKLLDQSNQVKDLLGQLGISGATALQDVIGKNLDLGSLPAMPQNSQAIRDQVYNANMQRVNTDTTNAREQANSSAIAAGLRPGTKAYQDAQDQISRQYNDAQQQAILNAGNAANQAYQQDMQTRQQALAELLTSRQTPLNEINALMSGSQVSNPFAGNIGYQPGASAQAGNIQGAVGLLGDYNTGIYNQQVASSNSNMAGAAGAAATVAAAFI